MYKICFAILPDTVYLYSRVSQICRQFTTLSIKRIELTAFVMKEQLSTLLKKLKQDSLPFKEVIAFIEAHYQHMPTAFKNGAVYNEATQNQGSAKVFAFAQLNKLTKEDTLYLFAEHYRSVLDNPDAADHQNIRQFMIHGWPGVVFEGQALKQK